MLVLILVGESQIEIEEMYLINDRLVSANIRKNGSIRQNATFSSNSNGDIISVHHKKDVVYMINCMPSITPSICIYSYCLL